VSQFTCELTSDIYMNISIIRVSCNKLILEYYYNSCAPVECKVYSHIASRSTLGKKMLTRETEESTLCVTIILAIFSTGTPNAFGVPEDRTFIWCAPC